MTVSELPTSAEPAADLSFPIISFAPFLHGTQEEQLSCAQEIHKSFSTYGWLYLKDHGIPQDDVDQMFAMSKKYFSLPLSEKLSHALRSAKTNQGYTADGAEANGGTDHKECYEHRRYSNLLGPSSSPSSPLPEFTPFMDRFYQQCYTLSLAVLRALSLTLNLPITYFDKALEKADPQLRLLHYPQIEKKVILEEGHARIIPHTDFGLCTLLFQDAVGGLEVDPFHTGQFRAAAPIRGTVVVNVADLLMRLSNGRLRSTLHRVTVPSSGSASGEGEEEIVRERFSTAFFVHPSAEVVVEPIVDEERGEKARYEPVVAGEWRNMHTAKNYRLAVES